MSKNSTMQLLTELKVRRLITMQQFRTFKGQVLSGNEEACLKGLKRLGLI